MNLLAKEYIAAQGPDNPGDLILSRFAGAAAECTAALLVNPYDPEAVATSIAHALSTPPEGAQKAEADRQRFRSRTRPGRPQTDHLPRAAWGAYNGPERRRSSTSRARYRCDGADRILRRLYCSSRIRGRRVAELAPRRTEKCAGCFDVHAPVV
jgi:hypothetical protein